MGRGKMWLGLLLFLISSSLVSALMVADSLSPTTLHLCGIYPDSGSLTAINVKNSGSNNITNLFANLILPSNSGITLLTNQTVYLGNISGYGNVSLNPSWNIQCNSNLPGTYQAYVQYTGVNYNHTSFNTNSTIIVHTYYNSSGPLLIFNQSPTTAQKITNPYVKLKISTNRDAVCKYSMDKNQHFDAMDGFLYTGMTEHEEILTGLEQKPYTYYVKCEESSGAFAENKVMFNVDLPPTAQIKLNKILPLKAGLISLTLKTSEFVIEPTLKYVLGNSEPRPIILSGQDSSGTAWSGSFTIGASENWTSGYFLFSATDVSGNIGSAINEGKTFIIDSAAPAAPGILNLIKKNKGEIELTWYNKEDDISYYNIYKSTAANVMGDVYKTTTEISFIDSFEEGEIYYYKVSAVDKAGNAGPLSSEVSTLDLLIDSNSLPGGSYSDPLNQTAGITQEGMENIGKDEDNGEVINEADESIDLAREVLNGINDLIKNLKDDKEVKILGLEDKLKESKVEVMKLIKELSELKSKAPEEIKKQIQEKKDKIASIRKTTPSNFQRGSEEEFDSSWEENEVAAFVKEFLAKEKIDSERKQEKYLKEIKKTQEKIQVISKIVPFTIEYYDGTKSKSFVVNKEVSVSGRSLNDVLLLEFSGGLVEKNEAVLSTGFEWVDPASFKKSVDELNTLSYSYVINKDISSDALRTIKTVVLPEFNKHSAETSGNPISSAITGFAVFDYMGKLSFYDIGIFLGAVAILGLIIYHVIHSARKKDKNNPSPHSKGLENPNPPLLSEGRRKQKDKEQQEQSSSSIFRQKIAKKIKTEKLQGLVKQLKDIFVKKGENNFDAWDRKINFQENVSQEKIHHVAQNQHVSLTSHQSWERTPHASPSFSGNSFPYLNYASGEYKKAGLEALKDFTIPLLYAEADTYVNTLNFDQAVKLYHVILANKESMAVASKDKHDDNSFNKKIPRLHKKLCLLIKLNQLHSCVESKDFLNLKHLLNETASMYNELLRETSIEEKQFLQTVNHYHRYYSQNILQDL